MTKAEYRAQLAELKEGVTSSLNEIKNIIVSINLSDSLQNRDITRHENKLISTFTQLAEQMRELQAIRNS